MPYSPEERKRILLDQGVDPNQYDFDEATGNLIPGGVRGASPDTTQSTTPNIDPTSGGLAQSLAAAGRAAGVGALPTAGSIAGGAATGAALGALGFNPLTVIGGGIAGALGAGMGTSYLQGKALETLAPDFNAALQEQLARDQEQNYWASFLGSAIPMAVGMKPDVSMLKAGARGVGKLIGNPLTSGAIPKVNPQEISALLNLGVGAGVGAGGSIGADIYQGRDIDWTRAAGEAALNALISKPRPWLSKQFPNAFPQYDYNSLPVTMRNVGRGVSEFDLLSPEYKAAQWDRAMQEGNVGYPTHTIESDPFGSVRAFEQAQAQARPYGDHGRSILDAEQAQRIADTAKAYEDEAATRMLALQLAEARGEVGGVNAGPVQRELLTVRRPSGAFGDVAIQPEVKAAGKNVEATKARELETLNQRVAQEEEARVAQEQARLKREEENQRFLAEQAKLQEEQTKVERENARIEQENALQAARLKQAEQLKAQEALKAQEEQAKLQEEERSSEARKIGEERLAREEARLKEEQEKLVRAKGKVPPEGTIEERYSKKWPNEPEPPKDTTPSLEEQLTAAYARVDSNDRLTPKQKELAKNNIRDKFKLAESLVKAGATRGSEKLLAVHKALAEQHGIELQIDPSVSSKETGEPVLGKMAIEKEKGVIKRLIASLTSAAHGRTQATGGHEILHGYIAKELEGSPSATMRRTWERFKKAVEADETFQAMKEHQGIKDAEEFLAEEGGWEIARRAAQKNPKLKESLKDIASAFKSRYGNATADDIKRILAWKATSEVSGPLGKVTAGKGVGGEVETSERISEKLSEALPETPVTKEQGEEAFAKLRREAGLPPSDSPEVRKAKLEEEHKRELMKDRINTRYRYSEKQIDTPQFKEWFGDSKVVDEEGKPLVVYHGTTGNFVEINKNLLNENALFGPGFYMTESKDVSSKGYAYKGAFSQDTLLDEYVVENNDNFEKARSKFIEKLSKEGEDTDDLIILPSKIDPEILEAHYGMEGSPNVIPLYAKIRNPFNMESKPDANLLKKIEHSGVKDFQRVVGPWKFNTFREAYKHYFRVVADKAQTSGDWSNFVTKRDFTEALQKLGYDGITHIGGIGRKQNNPHKVWIAFEPVNVKSALGNRGTFDPTDPDIRYSTPSQDLPNLDAVERDIATSEAPDLTKVPIPKRRSFLRFLEGTFDRVATDNPGKTGEYAAFRLNSYANDADENLGRYVNRPLMQMDDVGMNKAEKQEAWEFLVNQDVERAVQNKDTLSPKAREYVDKFREWYVSVHDDQRSMGIETTKGEAKDDPSHFPSIPDSTIIWHWKNSPQTDIAKNARESWLTFLKDKRGLSDKEALEVVDGYINAIGASPDMTTGMEFNAIRKAQGYGMPKEIRTTSLEDTLTRYGRRVAKDFAFFTNIQSDPVMRKAMHIADVDGQMNTGGNLVVPGSTDEVQPLFGTTAGKNARRFLLESFGYPESKTMAASRFVGSNILGLGTGVRNMLQLPALIATYVPLKQMHTLVKGLGSALTQDTRRKAYEANAYRKDINEYEFGLKEHPDKFIQTLDRLAFLARRVSGAETLEKFSRVVAYATGENVARMNFEAALSGDKRAAQWLNSFSNAKADAYIKAGEAPDEFFAKVAKQFTDRVQGTYDGRGLPLRAVDSPYAPFITLARWSIERSNHVMKDVIDPMRRGDYGPFLRYTLGAVLTGAAIEEVNQMLTGGKKKATPYVGEALAAENKEQAVFAMIAQMQLASYGGVMSDALKAMTDMASGRKVTGFGFPLISLINDSIRPNVSEAYLALREGEDPAKILPALSNEIIKSVNQTMRYAIQHTIGKEDVERSNKYRDLRVYEELTGEKEPTAPTQGGKIRDQELKEFHRTSDLSKAAELVPGLLVDAFTKSEGDPFKLMRNLRALKSNSYQTMPDPERMPLEFAKYLTYLSQTQGAEEASKRYADYMYQRQINKAKSGMLPTLGR